MTQHTDLSDGRVTDYSIISLFRRSPIIIMDHFNNLIYYNNLIYFNNLIYRIINNLININNNFDISPSLTSTISISVTSLGLGGPVSQ